MSERLGPDLFYGRTFKSPHLTPGESYRAAAENHARIIGPWHESRGVQPTPGSRNELFVRVWEHLKKEKDPSHMVPTPNRTLGEEVGILFGRLSCNICLPRFLQEISQR